MKYLSKQESCAIAKMTARCALQKKLSKNRNRKHIGN